MAVTATCHRPAGRRRVTRPPAARGAADAGAEQRRAHPWLFLAPYLVLFTAFVLAPTVYGIWISLHDWDYTLPGKPFVGLDNYRPCSTPTPSPTNASGAACGRPAIFTVLSVPLLLVVPLVVALAMNQKVPRPQRVPGDLLRSVRPGCRRRRRDVAVPARQQHRDGQLLPGRARPARRHRLDHVGPGGVVRPRRCHGLVDAGLQRRHLPRRAQDIPKELYEAAEVDGANAWQRFRNVTLPGLRPVTMFVTMVTIIASASMFGQAYLMTRGAPGTETHAIYQIAETGLPPVPDGQRRGGEYILTIVLMLTSLVVLLLFRERKAD